VGAVLLGAVILGILTPAFARTRIRDTPAAWGQAVVLGSLVFLIVLAIANDSFAGAPGYETLLFFAAVMAHEHLGLGNRPVVDEMAPAAGRMGDPIEDSAAP